MVAGLVLRVSWICLLLFSSGACFPATKDYMYPYTATGSSGGGSNLESEGSRPALVNLQYGPSANHQQPGAAPHQTRSPTGNRPPSSQGAPGVAAGSLPRYEPNRFVVTFDSSSNKPASAPAVPSPGARPRPPTDTGKKTPSSSVQPQPATGTGGNSNMGSGGAPSNPFYWASPFPAPAFPYPAAEYMAPTLDFGDGPVPYVGAPVTYNYGAGSSPHANSYPPTKDYYRYPYTATGGSGVGSGLLPPMVNLQNRPSAPQQASSPTGNQSPSQGAPSAPAAPSQVAGDVSPTAHSLPPTDTGETPKPQSAAGTSGNSNMGSVGAASSPVYWASFPAPGFPSTGAGYMAPTLDFGERPVPYVGAPVTYNYGAGSSPHANSYPPTKDNYRYPDTATGGSSGGSGLLPPMVNLQYRPSAPQQASSPTGNQSPSQGARGAPESPSQGAPSAPAAPSHGAGDVSPTARRLPPTDTGETPKPQYAAGNSGNSNMGSGGAASNPFYWASPFPSPGFPYPAAGYMVPTLDFGEGPVPYVGAPVTYNHDAGSSPHANSYPPTKDNYRYPYTATGGSGGGSGLLPPMVNLQYRPSAPQQASSPTGNQSPSQGAPSVPESPSQVAGDVSPTAHPLPTIYTGETPKPLSAAGNSGNSNMGSGGAASSPVYWASPFPAAGFPSTGAGYMAPTLDFADGPVPYMGAPVTYNYGAGSSPHANSYPPTKDNNRYPYTATGGSGGGSGLLPPMVNLQYRPSAPQQASSPTGNQSPSQGAPTGNQSPSQGAPTGNQSPSQGAPTGNKAPSQGAPGAPAAPSHGAGDVSPTARPLPPKPQSAAGTSGNSNMGSGGLASSPFYWASPTYPAAWNMATAYNYGAGSPHANSYPPKKGGQASPNTPATGGLDDGPVPYAGSYPYATAPATSNSGDGAASGPGQPSVTQPAEGVDTSTSDPTDGSYPDAAPATSNSDDEAGSAPGLPWYMQLAGGAAFSSPDPSNWMPSRAFPDFSIWDSNSEMPESASETSPLPPSSYIIQSRNGYQRARKVLSHTKYSPESPEPQVFPYKAAKAQRKT